MAIAAVNSKGRRHHVHDFPHLLSRHSGQYFYIRKFLARRLSKHKAMVRCENRREHKADHYELEFGRCIHISNETPNKGEYSGNGQSRCSQHLSSSWSQRTAATSSTNRRDIVLASSENCQAYRETARFCRPDGTEVEIRILPTSENYNPKDRILDDTPEAIEAWINALHQLEPLLITPEEQAAWDAASAQQKLWDKVHFFDRVDRLAKDLG